MQSSRVFELTRPFSSLIQSLLILSLFVGNLSTVSSAAQTEKPLTENVTEPSRIFPETEVLFLANATSKQRESLIRAIGSDSEALDMEYSSVSAANATLDPEEDSSSERTSVEPTASTTSSTSSAVSNSPGSDNMSTIATVTVKPNTPAIFPTPLVPPAATEAAPATASTTEATMTTATTNSPAKTEVAATTTIATTERRTKETENAAATLVNGKQGMPTGVVALVTVITFAIIAVAAYVSLIVWRRYLEYRYGNRELLVNDLELDSNDLRNFEDEQNSMIFPGFQVFQKA